ncbi:MAG: hypothetical protein R3D00_08850 [Bacteroidia bacterium]
MNIENKGMDHSESLSVGISDKRRWFEIIAVIVSGTGKFVFMDWLNWRFFYITIVCLFWGIYVYFRYKQNKKILTYWGFTGSNLSSTFSLVLPFGIIALSAFWVIGFLQNSLMVTWHILPLLILYPIWGTIQQFLIIGLVAGNLQDMEGLRLHKIAIVGITALVFAMVHYPFWYLIGGTGLLAVFYSIVYLRIKNLYVLGVFHGWLGAFFFYTVLERDPYIEVFGKFFE